MEEVDGSSQRKEKKLGKKGARGEGRMAADIAKELHVTRKFVYTMSAPLAPCNVYWWPRVPFWPNDADSRKLYFLSTKRIHFYERAPQCTPLAGVVTSYVGGIVRKKRMESSFSSFFFFFFFFLFFFFGVIFFFFFFFPFVCFGGNFVSFFFLLNLFFLFETRIATIFFKAESLMFKSFLDRMRRLND